MLLRALGFNLTRQRFSPRAQAVSSPRIVPQAASISRCGGTARSLCAVRDLGIVGERGGGGAAAASACVAAGLIGILFFNEPKEHSDDSGGDMTEKEMPVQKPVTINEAKTLEAKKRLTGAKISREFEMVVEHYLESEQMKKLMAATSSESEEENCSVEARLWRDETRKFREAARFRGCNTGEEDAA